MGPARQALSSSRPRSPQMTTSRGGPWFKKVRQPAIIPGQTTHEVASLACDDRFPTCSVAFCRVRDTGLFRRAVWPQANSVRTITIFFPLLGRQIGTSFETPSLQAGAADRRSFCGRRRDQLNEERKVKCQTRIRQHSMGREPRRSRRYHRLPPFSTLAHEMLMAGYDAKAGLLHSPYSDFEGAG